MRWITVSAHIIYQKIHFVNTKRADFSALSSLLLPLFSHTTAKAICLSLLEIGSASAFIAKEASLLQAPLCAFAVCFSGLSVYFQGKDIWKRVGLSAPAYLPVKAVQGGLAFLLALLFSV